MVARFCFAVPAASVRFDTVDFPTATNSLSESVLPTITAKWSGSYEGPHFRAKAAAEGVVQMSQGSPWTGEAPEAYLGTPQGMKRIQLALGRKVEDWSELDEDWGLGIWQPRFRWDYFRPQTVGLMGASLHYETPVLRFIALASPIFIPERGLPVSIENGNLSSPSPYFVSPPSAVYYSGVLTPVRYSLAMPSVNDVLFHPSVASQIRLGGEHGFWGSAAYAYKPINQIPLSFGIAMDVSQPPDEILKATIYPRVVYHQLGAVEGGYKGDTVGFSLSVQDELPVMGASDPAWVSQQYSPALTLSPGISFKLSPGNSNELSVGYFKQWGGNAPATGPQELLPVASGFEPRYPYQNALRLGVKLAVAEPLEAWSRVFYDMDHADGLWSSDLTYRFAREWTLALGADILGGFGSLSGQDFFGRYQGDNQVRAGVAYAF